MVPESVLAWGDAGEGGGMEEEGDVGGPLGGECAIGGAGEGDGLTAFRVGDDEPGLVEMCAPAPA